MFACRSNRFIFVFALSSFEHFNKGKDIPMDFKEASAARYFAGDVAGG